ncbi:MAG: hypothetical protein ABSG73_13870 [Candidatus Aminicenantales bacterium]|jgi:hypothetical protein
MSLSDAELAASKHIARLTARTRIETLIRPVPKEGVNAGPQIPAASDVMVVGDRDYRGFQFAGPDVAYGVTLISAAVAVSPASGLVPDDPAALLSADKLTCYAWVAASALGVYDVTFTGAFTDGKVLVRVYRVEVES